MWFVNPEDLCRPCVEEIVAADADWYFSPPSTPRPVQLTLIFHGLPKRQATPFGPYRKHSDGRYQLPTWAKAQRPAPIADDPRVLPPAVPGQIALFECRGRISIDFASRIRDRPSLGLDAVEPALAEFVAERSYTGWWLPVARDVVRLALALAAAEGKTLVDDAVLACMPRFAGAAAEALRRSGLLDPDCELRPAPRGPTVVAGREPRSCALCGAFGGTAEMCAACRVWALSRPDSAGVCGRCQHPALAIRDGWCRTCLLHVQEQGIDAHGTDWCQLWLADSAVGLSERPIQLSWRRTDPPSPTDRKAIAARTSVGLSPHLLVPGQGELFTVRRDWVNARAALENYCLSPAAASMLDRFKRHGQEHGWSGDNLSTAAKTLRILFGWLGNAAPIPEQDIRLLNEVGLRTRRTLRFLADNSLVIPDTARQSEPREHASHRIIANLPSSIRPEIEEWVVLLRREDRNGRPHARFATIRNYLTYAHPALVDWGRRYRTLREVTPADVDAAIEAQTGEAARHMGIALRSIFRTLKRNKTIFRDPTRGIVVPHGPTRPPRTLPSDMVSGLIDRATGAADRLAVALVAIHAVGQRELTRILVDDLSVSRSRLLIRRRHGLRVIHLDEVTVSLLNLWLHERHRRWSATRNPHLFISQQTAAETGPVDAFYLWRIFEPLGINLTQLRRDRIVDEARATVDPVHLMRVFGITADTALTYIYAAHPDKRPDRLH